MFIGGLCLGSKVGIRSRKSNIQLMVFFVKDRSYKLQVKIGIEEC